MYVCMHFCAYMCMSRCICVWSCIYCIACICVCMYTHAILCVYIFVCLCYMCDTCICLAVYICIYVLHVSVYMCPYSCTCMHMSVYYICDMRVYVFAYTPCSFNKESEADFKIILSILLSSSPGKQCSLGLFPENLLLTLLTKASWSIPCSSSGWLLQEATLGWSGSMLKKLRLLEAGIVRILEH